MITNKVSHQLLSICARSKLTSIKSKEDNVGFLSLKYFNKISMDKYRDYHVAAGNKAIYDTIFESKVLKRYLNNNKLTIVDVGAGCCDLEKELQRLFKSHRDIMIVSLDISWGMLKKSAFILGENLKNIHCLLADAYSTGLQNDCSDITFLINVLPYIKDGDLLLRELHRITRKSGIIFVIYPVNNKYGFWKTYFEHININLHDDIEKYYNPEKYKIIEVKTISINPIKDLNIINVPIAKLNVLKVLK